MDESLGAITILGVDQSLRDAAQQGNIDALYAFIRSDAKVLDRIDEIPFVETPLHTAASAGQIQFAMEIMTLKPSFAKKLNEDGFSPVHVALQNNRTEVALRLVYVDEDLVRVKGKEGLTPLHCIAQIGNLDDVLVEFLKACPKSIEDVTNRGETVLHIALKSNMFDVVRVLLGWLRRAWFRNASRWETRLLNWKDDEGNTVLHIAVSKNQTKIVKLLLRFRWFFWRYTIDINAKNSWGCTALGMLQGDNQEIKRMLRRARYFSYCCPSFESNAYYFKSPVKIEDQLYIIFLRLSTEISNDLRNVLLVVAALLVTISFQAVIAPPGGVWQETKYRETNNYTTPNNNATGPPPAGSIISHHAGTAVMQNTDFPILAGLNVISFFVTVFTILLLLPAGFGSRMFCLPLYTLSLCFIASICIISPNTNDISPGLSWIWNNFILFCVFSPMLFQYLVYIVSRRRNKLVDAFLLKGKAPDPTLM